MTKENKNADFKSYPTRAITISDKIWKKLKMAKIKSGKTWTNFLEQLIGKQI